MKKLLFILIPLTLGLYASPSSAQIFKLNFDSTGNATIDNFIRSQLSQVEADVNKDLPSGDTQRMMEGMANSSVMAGKGIGTDHASGMDVFLIGAGVGVGADLHKDKTSNTDLSGIGVAPGVVIGGNLASLVKRPKILGLESKRLAVFFNFMNYGMNHTFGKDGSATDASVKSTAIGFHIRYQLVSGRGSKIFGWGGIKFHTGYEYNKTDFTFTNHLSQTINASSGTGETISNQTITGSPKGTVLVNTHSIPLELSTDVRLLYVLSLYTGFGADYNRGQAKGDGSLNSSPTNITCTGGVCGGSTSITVRPEANIDAKANVNPFLYRAFAGVQINLPYMRIFVQGNKGLGNDLASATAGVRFVY